MIRWPVVRLTALVCVLAAGGTHGEVRTNESAGRDYHHLTVNLTADMLLPAPENRDRDLAYRISDGGMFEAYLPPEALPGVAAPGCSRIVLRMPWTDPDYPDSAQMVDEKAELLEQIRAVRAGSRDVAAVTVELDPYVERVAGRWSLTQCTAFFRTARGRYVPHDGPL